MSGTPVKRTDWAGSPRAKAGAPRAELPTQDLDDLFIVEMAPYRAENFEFPPYDSPHPRSAEHKLKRQQLVTTNDNQTFVQQIYMKDTGALLVGEQVDASTQGETAEIKLQRVAHGTAADKGFLVVSSSVEPQDAQLSQKRTVTVDEWPILKGTYVDEASGVVVAIEKTFVPNGTEGGVIGGKYVEVQPHDKYKSIQISSQVVSLPDPEVVPWFGPLNLPSKLTKLEVVWDEQKGGGASASGTSASASAHSRVAAVIIPHIEDGFRGSASGTIARSWHMGIPSVTAAVTKINTTSGLAWAVTKYKDQNNAIGTNSIAVKSSVGISTNLTRIHSVLTNGVEITGDTTHSITDTWFANTSESLQALATTLAEGECRLDISPSTPVAFSSSDEIVVRVVIEKWRFGVYVMEVYSLIVP